MAGTFTCLRYHIVFSTKDREPSISSTLRPRLDGYIGAIVKKHKGVLLAAGGMPDHIHLLVSLSADVAIADMARLIKSNTSKWIHEEFPEQAAFCWQIGYGAFSVSESQTAIVTRYIDRQEEHHRTKTFKEEFLEFLHRHQIAFDPERIWQ